MVKDSTFAVVSLRRRIARFTLNGVAGLLTVSAVGYSAVLAKEARTLPALASIQKVDADPLGMETSTGNDSTTPSLTLVAGPVGAENSLKVNPFRLTSPVEAAPTSPAVIAATEPVGPVVIQNRYAQDPSVRWFDGRPIKPVRKMWMTVTGYSPDARSCGDSADGLTATLHSVHTNGSRLVAADPTVLNYGSMLTVPGYDTDMVVPVLDCGGAIKGRRLDLLFPTHEQARNWGVQRLLVTVWGYADGLPAENPRKMR